MARRNIPLIPAAEVQGVNICANLALDWLTAPTRHAPGRPDEGEGREEERGACGEEGRDLRRNRAYVGKGGRGEKRGRCSEEKEEGGREGIGRGREERGQGDGEKERMGQEREGRKGKEEQGKAGRSKGRG